MNNKVLSICIPSHDRIDNAVTTIDNILDAEIDGLDIKVSDSSAFDKYSYLKDRYRDNPDVSIIRNEIAEPMVNWFKALESADGVYMMHVNDRDRINVSGMNALINFLKNHAVMAGGICKYVRDDDEYSVFEKRTDALMNVPYFSSHPTGIVFNTAFYKNIQDRENIFTKEYSVMHPHDIILGRLSIKGDLFLYRNKVWEYATNNFYINYRSAFVEKDVENLYFSPRMRMKELDVTIEEINGLDINKGTIRKKIFSTLKYYGGLCTTSYFHMLETEHEAAHYGLRVKHYSLMEKISFTHKMNGLMKGKYDIKGISYCRYCI